VFAPVPAHSLWISNDDRIWQRRANGYAGTYTDISIDKADSRL